MKRKIIIFAASLLVILCCVLPVMTFLCSDEIKVDNITPKEQIVTKYYGLERQLLAREIFHVRKGFRDVNAKALAKEVGFKLECKRQISKNLYYYVILGDYNCYIVVDENDIVHHVLTLGDLPTIAQTKRWLEKYDDLYIGDVEQFTNLMVSVGNSSAHWTNLYTLEDGVLVVKGSGKPETARYQFYTDEEWQQEYQNYYDSFALLPMDKQDLDRFTWD